LSSRSCLCLPRLASERSRSVRSRSDSCGGCSSAPDASDTAAAESPQPGSRGQQGGGAAPIPTDHTTPRGALYRAAHLEGQLGAVDHRLVAPLQLLDRAVQLGRELQAWQLDTLEPSGRCAVAAGAPQGQPSRPGAQQLPPAAAAAGGPGTPTGLRNGARPGRCPRWERCKYRRHVAVATAR
jgi:hypothetical protein